MVLECTRCHKEKPESDFSCDNSARALRNRNGRANWCKQCFRELHQKHAEEDPDYWKKRNGTWRRRNPERFRELARYNQRDAYTRLKVEVVNAYGGKCACCGESEIHFLTIDHVNGLQPKHRHTNGRRITGLKMLRMVKSEGFPDEYRVLCQNCNTALGFFGFCPHQPHEDHERRYPREEVVLSR